LNKEGIPAIVLRFARTVLLTDFVLAGIIGLACYVLDFHTLEGFGTLLVWAGVALVLFACFTAIGGFAARAEDAIAFSRSGAGNTIDNLPQITDARSSNLGCFLHLVFVAIVLIGVGFLLQITPYLS